MSKLQLTCIDCGFPFFVDSATQARAYGWHVEPETLVAQCPACAATAQGKGAELRPHNDESLARGA